MKFQKHGAVPKVQLQRAVLIGPVSKVYTRWASHLNVQIDLIKAPRGVTCMGNTLSLHVESIFLITVKN